jgi:predicted TPR repeat methyltransferase
MAMHGPEFYDDAAVFAAYVALRAGPDSPNDTLEQPILRELAGPLADRRILDLGCGAAGFGRHALASGCAAYVGVDGSRNMVAAARQALAGTPGTVLEANLERWEPPVTACDLEAVVARAARALVPGGRLVVSVEHPIVTCTAGGWSAPARETALVDDYFASGPRDTTWLGGG